MTDTSETPFVRGFIEAMFFTESNELYGSEEWFTEEAQEDIAEGRCSGSIPKDLDYSGIHPDSLAMIREFCRQKQNSMADLLAEAYARPGYSEEQAGRDVWFTYNGHGVGFWDREELADDSGEYKAARAEVIANRHDSGAWNRAMTKLSALPPSLGDRLSEACGRGECHVWFGDHVKYGYAPYAHFEVS